MLPNKRYGQIVAWGQYAIPMLVTGAVLVPAGVSNTSLISITVPLGFEGGHGTAVSSKESVCD